MRSEAFCELHSKALSCSRFDFQGHPQQQFCKQQMACLKTVIIFDPLLPCRWTDWQQGNS